MHRGPSPLRNVHELAEQDGVLPVHIDVFLYQYALVRQWIRISALTVLIKGLVLIFQRPPILLLKFDIVMRLYSAECRLSEGLVALVDDKVAKTLVLLREVLLDESRRRIHHFLFMVTRSCCSE